MASCNSKGKDCDGAIIGIFLLMLIIALVSVLAYCHTNDLKASIADKPVGEFAINSEYGEVKFIPFKKEDKTDSVGEYQKIKGYWAKDESVFYYDDIYNDIRNKIHHKLSPYFTAWDITPSSQWNSNVTKIPIAETGISFGN
jgi:hypothetical protein